jgi:hypothetical protein
MKYIYVLALKNNKYYIGITSNPTFRLNQHFKFNGPNWTKRYKPIKIIEIIPNCDNFDEDKYTLKYMKIYGIDNVRGGSFCEMVLNNIHICTIERMINSSSKRCYSCNEIGHFANECYNNNKKRLLNTIDTPTKKFRKNIICYNCGNEGHFRDECKS